MDIRALKKTFDELFQETGKVVVGQQDALKQIVISLLCDGNALLESYPGLAKTLSIKTLASLMDLKFGRIQGTPDLMPSDIIGTYVLEESGRSRDFRFQPGPIFCNLLLADEINRATPKTQSALLEAMQEKQITVGNKTFKLDLPFLVLATQNPIEQEGTYVLPEAQADRFLLKIKLDYPGFEDEVKIVDRYADVVRDVRLKPVINQSQLLKLQQLTRQVPIANDIKRYAVDLVARTRKKKELIEYGASPRASIGLVLASKASALLNGRLHVSKDDINAMALPILRHRIILNFEAERNNMAEDDVIRQMIK